MSTWSPVDATRPPAAWHGATLAAAELNKLWDTIPNRINQLFLEMAGQPRAASTEPGTGTQPSWCWTHERDLGICRKAELFCGGDPYRPGADPTGEAACNPDQAAADHTELIRLLRARESLDRRIVTLIIQYPDRPSAPATKMGNVTAPEDWCTSCFRNGGHHEPIGTRSDGTPYYTGLCRFCGQFRANYTALPPARILQMHHEGRSISAADITRALTNRTHR